MIEQLELLKQLLGIESVDISRDDILAHYLKKANSTGLSPIVRNRFEK
jgi:hypothetical protein